MPPQKVESPFVGLVPYTEQDAPFFFGRERDQQRILANLFASRLTILYGASGVGKSSVLRAGIVNEVRQRITESRALGESPEIAVVYFKDWKGDILAKLRAAISAAMLDLLGRDYLEDLAQSLPLDELLIQAGARFGGDVLLILDQFEEYFLYRPAGAPDDFAAQFAIAANRPGLPANFVLSLRDDSIARLDRFKPLIPNLFANYLRIHHLTGEGARDAILKPVEHYNELPEDDRRVPGKFTVEPELVDLVIEQSHTGRVLIGQVGQGTVGSENQANAVETPYFQLVMTRLWREEVQRASHVLRASTLRDLGGAETIIRTHLENALAGLTDAEREICARLFPHLVTPSGTKIAHTVPNLAKFAKSTPEAVKPLLDNLAGPDKRILSIVAPQDGRMGEEQYEIYHDSLAQAVLSWQARFEASMDAKVRAKSRRRVVGIAVALGIAFLVAASAAGFAYWQYTRAEEARVRAEQATLRAVKAENDAYALKTQADEERLRHQQEDAEKAKNHALVALLGDQIKQVQVEGSKFRAKAAKPGSDVGGLSPLAEAISQRDQLLEQLIQVQKEAPMQRTAPREPPVQQQRPVVQPQLQSQQQMQAQQAAPPPRVEETRTAREVPAQAPARPPVQAQQAVVKPPSNRTLTLSRIVCRQDGGPGSTEWSFEIFALDSNGARTSIGKVERTKFDDKKPPHELQEKFTLPAGTGKVVVAGRRQDNPFLHTAAESDATSVNGALISITLQAKRHKDGDFEFTFKVD